MKLINYIKNLFANSLSRSFYGNLVEVMTTSSITSSGQNDTYVTKPYIIQGYLLGDDTTFVYMGDNKKDIRFSINKESIVAIDRINEEPAQVSTLTGTAQDNKQMSKKDLPEGTFYVDNRSKTSN